MRLNQPEKEGNRNDLSIVGSKALISKLSAVNEAILFDIITTNRFS